MKQRSFNCNFNIAANRLCGVYLSDAIKDMKRIMRLTNES